MRGETLEDFLKTRNTQVIYSVAGRKVKLYRQRSRSFRTLAT
jgi:hypothetical protein